MWTHIAPPNQAPQNCAGVRNVPHCPENVLRIEVQETNSLHQLLMHLPPLEKPVYHQHVWTLTTGWQSLQLGNTAKHENQKKKKKDECGYICAIQIDFSSVFRLEKCLLSLRPAQKVLDSPEWHGTGAIQTVWPSPYAFIWALWVTMKTLAPNHFHFLSCFC